MNNIPILILTFNRLNPVITLINKLRILKPKNIYVVSDGPRNGKEKELINEIREKVLTSIDWDCQIHTRFRTENFGCKYGVHDGVQWFFSQVEQGIVLEDDCIPDMSFFSYCHKLLIRYKDDFRIGSISGRNELGNSGTEDVLFISKFICWGWASWSNRVNQFDIEYGYKRKDDIKLAGLSYIEKLHLKSMRGSMLTKQVNSWAFSYDFSFRENKQLCVIPSHNLVSNIGFGVEGTHSSSRVLDGVDIYSFEDLSIPEIIENNTDYLDKLILKLYPLPKLLLLSKIKYLYHFRNLYKKICRFKNVK
ncbi:hypothetical protein ACPV30_15945 [Photobacterium damselae]|uniref:hypothetical protein n=1 Tax=Photobacterium damselae TaxID=38293 RepID=UPI004068EC80